MDSQNRDNTEIVDKAILNESVSHSNSSISSKKQTPAAKFDEKMNFWSAVENLKAQPIKSSFARPPPV